MLFLPHFDECKLQLVNLFIFYFQRVFQLYDLVVQPLDLGDLLPTIFLLNFKFLQQLVNHILHLCLYFIAERVLFVQLFLLLILQFNEQFLVFPF